MGSLLLLVSVSLTVRKIMCFVYLRRPLKARNNNGVLMQPYDTDESDIFV